MKIIKHYNVQLGQHLNVRESEYPLDMDGLGARVKEARDLKGLRQWQLAKLVTQQGVKIGQSGIGNIESGITKNPNCIAEIGMVLGVTVTWLRTGKGPRVPPVVDEPPAENSDSSRVTFPQVPIEKSDVRQLDHMNIVALRSEMPKDLPVLGSVSGGNGGVVMQVEAIDYVRRHPSLVGRTDVFGLFVEDGSMVPAYNPGDLVIVEGKPPQIGDHVVVEFKDSEHGDVKAILKKLKKVTSTTLELEQYAPAKIVRLQRSTVIRQRRILTMMDLFGM